VESAASFFMLEEICEISGFPLRVIEVFVLQRSYAAYADVVYG
jgi:hypothetical protein